MDTTHGANGRVRLDVADGVAEIRMVHPEKRNCFSLELAGDFSDLISAVKDRDDVSVVVVTADGPVFSSGVDLDVLTGGDPEERERLLELLIADVCRGLHHAPVPVVVAARGPAIGGGATLLCYSADLKVVSPAVEVWWPEIAYGAAPLERTVYLAREIGETRALELMLLGEDGKMGAEEARQLGLVNRVVDPDDVEPTAREMAATIAGHDAAHEGVVTAFTDAVYRGRGEASGASAAHAIREEDEHW